MHRAHLLDRVRVLWNHVGDGRMQCRHSVVDDGDHQHLLHQRNLPLRAHFEFLRYPRQGTASVHHRSRRGPGATEFLEQNHPCRRVDAQPLEVGGDATEDKINFQFLRDASSMSSTLAVPLKVAHLSPEDKAERTEHLDDCRVRIECTKNLAILRLEGKSWCI